MKARKMILLILVGLSLLFLYDYSQGGVQKIGAQISRIIILPAPTGGTKLLDEEWLEK